MCEPKLDKRNLYPTLGTKAHKIEPRKIMNFLMYSNGRYSIDKISNFYETNSWPDEKHPKYLNIILKCYTKLNYKPSVCKLRL